ncbi:hypothetical protein TRFO_20631 [Tritrichomonas foetus]|uniref:Uncharacterized protein n=1 Tax=Tritrichomonas foetus TaxID=1144522 RepID=A0A1J4KKE9_9EUKA|nr:hypothetical protein TRFO_20631 [Tritrichomonas foetus]|eukprot:OHT10166.1 hypothetical protein TRFO_20631 [Tritrichomonas foetus]
MESKVEETPIPQSSDESNSEGSINQSDSNSTSPESTQNPNFNLNLNQLNQPVFPPHPINLPQNPPPNSARPRLGKFDPLPPLNTNGQYISKQYPDVQKSDDFKKRTAMFEKKKQLFVQGIVKNHKKNMPLDPLKESQVEKYLNSTKRSQNSNRIQYRQTFKLPPMEELPKEKVEKLPPVAEEAVSVDN